MALAGLGFQGPHPGMGETVLLKDCFLLKAAFKTAPQDQLWALWVSTKVPVPDPGIGLPLEWGVHPTSRGQPQESLCLPYPPALPSAMILEMGDPLPDQGIE